MTADKKVEFDAADAEIIRARTQRDNDEKTVAKYLLFNNEETILFDWGLLNFKIDKYFACQLPQSIECQSADKLRNREEAIKNAEKYYIKGEDLRVLDD